MRRKIELTNETHWRDDHLLVFIRRAAAEVLDEGTKPLLRVRVAYTRRCGTGSSGCAYVGGRWMTIRLAREHPDKIDLASTLVHELGHIRGLTHKDMARDAARWRRVGSNREIFAWGETLPLEKKAPRKPRPKPTAIERAEAGLARAQAKVREHEAKLKQARQTLQRWKRRAAHYTKRQKLLAAAAASVAAADVLT